MSEQNKNTIRRFWDQVFNGRQLDAIDSMFTDDYVYHGPAGQEIRGAEGLKQLLGMYFNAFPDVQVQVEDVLADGDKVMSRVIGRGTHEGEIMGIPPTGKKIEMTVLCINRFVGDRVAEDWELVDLFAMMQQLGVIQAPA